MANVPHFDLPFRVDSTGHAIDAEQDTLEDVTNCVVAIMKTTVGQRIEMPSLGISDPAFQKQPIDLAAIAEDIANQEPRASLFLIQHPDKFDSLIAKVLAQVSTSEGGAST